MLPKISVIIPIYGVEPYLRRCLDSVCGQSLREIEIICINDASPDNCLQIAHAYAARDSRILVINFSHNRGVSAARNAGMAVARGEYLGFVDSDDAIDTHFYERLYARAHETDATIVKGVLHQTSVDGITAIVPLNDKVRQSWLDFRHQWTTAVYRTSFIRENGIGCPLDVSNGQDVAFLCKAVSLVRHVEIVDDADYYYFRRPGSSYSDILGHNKILAEHKYLNDVVRFLNSHEIDDEAYDKLFFHSLWSSLRCFRSGAPDDATKNCIACAQAGINIYSVCKRRAALDANLCDNIIYEFLHKADATGLAQYLQYGPKTSKPSGPGQIATNLRARLLAVPQNESGRR